MLPYRRLKRGPGELVDLPVQRERVTREFTAANGASPIVSSTMETAVIFVSGQVFSNPEMSLNDGRRI